MTKMAGLPKLVYKFNPVPVTLSNLSVELENMFLKFIWENKYVRIARKH